MEGNNRKEFRFIISMFIILILGLFLLAFWNESEFREIKTSKIVVENLKRYLDKADISEKNDGNHEKDFLKQKAVALCFEELIGKYEEKFSPKQKQDCIQLIMLMDEKCRHQGVDAPLVLAWLEKESQGNPEAISYAGAKGLTQIMDVGTEVILPSMGYSKEFVFDPVINLAGGLSYLVNLMKYWTWKGTKSQYLIIFYALHSYNWGAGNTEKLFNSDMKEERPDIEYVNWIFNRREYWGEKLDYWMDDAEKFVTSWGKKIYQEEEHSFY